MQPDDIIALRKKLGISQERFAHLLGTTAGTVNRWEKGRFKPSRLYVREIKDLEGNNGINIRRRKANQES